jgi:2-dehydro-3-deoxygalactonokinase
MTASLIAIDWGTTNRRVYVLNAAGAVIETVRDAMGLLAVPAGDFASEVAAIRLRHGDLPVLLAGMVGSAKGWVEVPYRPCPTRIEDLAASLHWIDPQRTAIVPGVADPAGDVMRGEEVQILGAAAGGLVPGDALLCQPGTHCKWARVRDGRLIEFATAMTGELFALLKSHSLLADFLQGAIGDGPSFREGVRDAMHGQLTTRLFRVRATALLGQRAIDDSAAYTSGLLIGHDVCGQTLGAGQSVYLLADPQLGALYATAIRLAGGEPVIIDSQAAFVAGINHIWKASQP